jgi:hypothetical protein
MDLAELRSALEALGTYSEWQLDMYQRKLNMIENSAGINCRAYSFNTMIHIPEIGCKSKLLPHFFPKWHTLVHMFLIKGEIRDITHYVNISRKLRYKKEFICNKYCRYINGKLARLINQLNDGMND